MGEKADPGNGMYHLSRILLTLVIEGSRVDDLKYLSEHNISPEEVSATLSSIFNEMTFISGHLHCDPHLGNLIIRSQPSSNPNFDIVLLDHGLYRQLPEDLRVNYAHLWLSIISNEIPSMKRYSKIV